MVRVFLQPREEEILKNIRVTDEHIKISFPVDQPYIYTANGEPIIFYNSVGFLPPEECLAPG